MKAVNINIPGLKSLGNDWYFYSTGENVYVFSVLPLTEKDAQEAFGVSTRTGGYLVTWGPQGCARGYRTYGFQADGTILHPSFVSAKCRIKIDVDAWNLTYVLVRIVRLVKYATTANYYDRNKEAV